MIGSDTVSTLLYNFLNKNKLMIHFFLNALSPIAIKHI